jgi:hypothetical protein
MTQVSTALQSSFNSVQPAEAIVFIDAHVTDVPLLLNSIKPGIEALVLSSDQDGVVQITQALQARPSIRTIYLVAHASPGCLQLGNTSLSLSTIDCYTPHLQSWFSALVAPTLHLYACDLAAGDAGEEFLNKLHRLTRASLTASAQVVGNAEQGGTWQL